MEWADNTTEVLYFLVPGFIAAAVYYGLTSAAKPNTFERLIQALIFTIIVQALSQLVSLTGWLEDETWQAVAPSGTVVIAVIIGFLAALLANKDVPHRWLRKWRITKETAYPNDWYGVFASNPDCFVILHLRDRRRLYGWPNQWPGREQERLFVIDGPQWLTDTKETIDSGKALVVQAEDVEMVESLEVLQEQTTEEQEMRTRSNPRPPRPAGSEQGDRKRSMNPRPMPAPIRRPPPTPPPPPPPKR